MCVSICSLMWLQPTTCGPLMYDNSHMAEPQEEAGGRSQEPEEEVMCRGWSWVGGIRLEVMKDDV